MFNAFWRVHEFGFLPFFFCLNPYCSSVCPCFLFTDMVIGWSRKCSLLLLSCSWKSLSCPLFPQSWWFLIFMAQLAGLKKSPTASLQKDKTPPTNVLDVTQKLSDAAASVMMELWEIQSITYLTSLPSPRCPRSDRKGSIYWPNRTVSHLNNTNAKLVCLKKGQFIFNYV